MTSAEKEKHCWLHLLREYLWVGGNLEWTFFKIKNMPIVYSILTVTSRNSTFDLPPKFFR